MQEKRRKPGQRGDRPRGNEFMDVARQAFVRFLALEKWREVQDARETLGLDWAQAARECRGFPGRGPYRDLWVRRWEEHLTRDVTTGDAGTLFAAIEQAIAAALEDEEAERRRRGVPPLEEDPEYKAFVDQALENLLRQAGEPGFSG
jgi:hypothetical protein